MSFVDNLLMFSSQVTSTGTLAAVAANGTSTSAILTGNAIDVGTKVRDMGEGQPLFASVTVGTAASGGTSVQFDVVASDSANGTGNVIAIGTTGAIPVASLTAGARFAFPISPRLASLGQQYLSLRYTTVGAVTALTVYADLRMDVQDGTKYYPSGYTTAT